MSEKAYFFQGDKLLLPADITESHVKENIPCELQKNFKNPDVFEIPAINEPAEKLITVVSISPDEALPENWKSIPVRRILTMFYADNNNSNTKKIIRACHFAQWRQESGFCGTCGSENSDVAIPAHRLCPKCGRMEFPRICPAVIVIVTDSEDRILLAHNKRFREGLYSHISGFNEAGETLEETVAREVHEEVRINVKNTEYVKSQPWPFPNSLMIGFKAKYQSGTIMPDGDEIDDAKWFSKNNLPELPGEGSLSRYLINEWLSGKI